MSLNPRSFHYLSRTHPHRTLLPFLYQTATIQKRPLSFSSRRSARDEYVPFEGEPSQSSAAPDSKKTTLTASERAVFEKLQKTVGAEESSSTPLSTSDDKTSDPNDPDAGATLDSVFDAVLRGGTPPPRPNRFTITPLAKTEGTKKTENLTTLAASILKNELEWSKKQSKEKAEEQARRLRELREKERERINVLFTNAQTDTEVWDVLQREVFAPIKALDLDGTQKPKPTWKSKGKKGGSATTKSSPTTTEKNTSIMAENTAAMDSIETAKKHPGILFPNFPHHVLYATRRLRSSFPTSPLPLCILPQIKALGRAAYMLCATTALYTTLIRTAWIQYGSYEAVDELLTEMDNNGIEFDFATLKMLEEILEEAENARSGAYGMLMKEVWQMERYAETKKRLAEWKDVVMGRLNKAALRRISEGKLVRKTNSLNTRDEEEIIWPMALDVPNDVKVKTK